MSGDGEERDGVRLTNLDAPLAPGYQVTKRDLVDYLDAVHEPLVRVLHGRALSVIRVHRDSEPFMQKNLPRYTPEWVASVTMQSDAGRRQVRYALCDDRRTLLWFANQRAVEYHPQLFRGLDWGAPTDMVVDLDPPQGGDFAAVVATAVLVRQVLTEAGMAAAVKTSGAKGVHVVVPLAEGTSGEDTAAATRAVAARVERADPALATTAFLKDEREGKVFVDATRAGGATVVAAYSPRLRPGLPVSFPVAWEDLPDVRPADFTTATAPGLLAGRDRWRDLLPGPQHLDGDLVAEGHSIPVARVAAMHAGKRRARERRRSEGSGGSPADNGQR